MKKSYALAITLTALLFMAASASAEKVVNTANGHTYEMVSSGPITFDNARTAAAGMTLNGFACYGHLVTITSAEENAFIVNAFEGIDKKWIGAFQNATYSSTPNTGWQWVTGEQWGYTNWNAGEPNNKYYGTDLGYEDAVTFWGETGVWNDAPHAYLYSNGGYIVEYDCREVLIDIKPGSFPNSINSDSKGVIPVAILTTDDFDASVIDPFSVTLDGMEVRVKGKSGNAGSMEDVDGDGDLDLVVQIVDEGTFVIGDSTATLTAFTYGGVQVFGTDTIRIVPAN